MASTWSALKIELLETGQNSGTWGTLTNVNLGDAVLGEAITGSATVDFPTDADVTITLTDSATSQSARNLRLNITESSTGIGSIRNLILGSGCQIEKFYLINNTGTGAKTVKNTTGTGISVPAGKATLVYNNGTNVVDAATYFTSLTLGSALPVASGGTGLTAGTSGGVLAYTATGTLASSAALTQYGVVYGGGAGVVPAATAAGTTGQVLTATTSGAPSWAAPATSGTVTSVAMTVPSVLSISGSPITSSGTLALTYSGTALPVLNGGTGVTTSTGTTNVVLSNSPTLVTPDLGTPSALVGTNITGTATAFTASNVTTNANLTGGVTSVGNAATVVTNANLTGGVTSVGNAATVVTNANLTGDITSVGNATTLTNAPVIAKVLTGYVSGAGTVAATDSILQAIQKLNGNDATNANLTGAVTSVGNATSLGSFTSLQLLTALTDETGTGAAVFATSPTLVTPALGAATATSLVSSGTAASSFTVTSGSAVPFTITNLGTGNSFVVEDSASTDSTPVVVTAAGVTVVGHTAAITGVFNAAFLEVHNVAGNTAQSILRYSADAFGPDIDFVKSRSATTGTQTVVVSGDLLGSMRFAGSDGTAFIQGALIEAKVDGTPGLNDMPGRLIFSTTADGASTPTERMRIDSVGNVGIGATATANSHLAVRGTHVSSSGFAQAYYAAGSVDASTTTRAEGYLSGIGTIDAAFTCASLSHFYAGQGTITGGSRTAVTSQYGFITDSTLTGATNNYGFFSNIASGTNRFNFYAGGTADNVFIGAVSIGNTKITGASLSIRNNITGSTNAYGAIVTAEVQSDVTSGASIFVALPSTQATAFTLNNLRYFYASQSTIGAGSTVTSQYGVNVESTLTGATNNYGFYSSIAAAANRWNFYAAGTAANLFSGVSQFAAGTAALPGITQISDLNTGIFFPAADTLGFTTGGSERMRIDSGGNVGIGLAPTTKLQVYGAGTTAAFYTNGDASGSTVYLQSTGGTAGDGGQILFGASFGVFAGIKGMLTNGTGPAGDLVFQTRTTSGNVIERMRVDAVGQVGIGGTPSAGRTLTLSKNITGNTTAYTVLSDGAISADVTANAIIFRSGPTNSSALTSLIGFQAAQPGGTLTSVTNQFGFVAETNLTGATNNYGFYGNIAAAANRYNFYANGTADNYFAGSVGIGNVTFTGAKVVVGGSATGSTTVYGVVNTQTIQSDVTANALLFATSAATAASVTLTSLFHYNAAQATFSGTSVTSQYGFVAASSLTGATNNYGVYSGIASGTNRFNFYAAGTAINYFAGVVQTNAATAIPAGGTTGTGFTFSSTANFGVFFGSGAPTLTAAKGSLYLRSDGSTTNDRMYVNTNGSTTWTNVTTAA